jgi:hypothetical protein
MIKHDLARPAMNERLSVEIFYAADTQRTSILHSLGAGELCFSARLG